MVIVSNIRAQLMCCDKLFRKMDFRDYLPDIVSLFWPVSHIYCVSVEESTQQMLMCSETTFSFQNFGLWLVNAGLIGSPCYFVAYDVCKRKMLVITISKVFALNMVLKIENAQNKSILELMSSVLIHWIFSPLFRRINRIYRSYYISRTDIII